MSSRDPQLFFKNYFTGIVKFLKVSGLWRPSANTKLSIKVLYFFYNGLWFCCQFLHVVPSEFMTALQSGTMIEGIQGSRDFGNHFAVLKVKSFKLVHLAKGPGIYNTNHAHFFFFTWNIANLLQIKKLYYRNKDTNFKCLSSDKWLEQGPRLLKVLQYLLCQIFKRCQVMLMEVLENYKLDYEDWESVKFSKIAEFHRKRSMRWVHLFTWSMTYLVGSIWFSHAMDIFLNRDLLIKHTLPMSIYLPVRNDTRVQHAATTLFMLCQFSMLVPTTAAVDGIFVVTATCITANFGVLSQALRTIRPRSLKLAREDNQVTLNNIMTEELLKCIRHLQAIYRDFITMEAVFCHQVGLQMTLSWIQICFTLYLGSLNNVVTGVGDVLYLIAILMELLVYCVFGDEITRAHDEVGEALYDCCWEETDPKFKRALQITMIRVTRPVYVTVSKLSPLNLPFFLTILRGGYSLSTLLRTKELAKESGEN